MVNEMEIINLNKFLIEKEKKEKRTHHLFQRTIKWIEMYSAA